MTRDLIITVTAQTELDYDDVSEDVKEITAVITCVNGNEVEEAKDVVRIEEDTVSDADCKTNMRTELTALGYVWDTENGV